MSANPSPAPSLLLDAAREWYRHGFAVIPSHEDGSKRPFGKWKQYQSERPTWDEVEGWLSSGRYTGIGVLCGKASGNLELIEIEGPMQDAVERLGRVIATAAKYDSVGADTLLAEIARGCVEQSAGGGLHLFVRISDGPAKPNTRLAYAGVKPDRKVVAETRGEGGFVIVAPTTGRTGHEPGAAYLFINGGSPDRTVVVTSEDRDILHMVMHLALNEDPDHTLTDEEPDNHAAIIPEASSTFDDYRNRVTWREILEPAGWTWSHRDGERDYWTRPGKKVSDGISASTIEDGPLFNFSANADLPEERGMTKAQVYAHLHYDGDLSATAKALREAGYGASVTYADLTAWEMEAPVQAAGTDPDDESELPDDDPYTRAVRNKYAELRVYEDARQMLASEKAGKAPALDGLGLGEFLAQPDEEERYRVTDLWPLEGRVMLAAAAKSGKTTMVAANLIPSLVDGVPFLGRYDCQKVTGTVVLLNMEVGERTLRRWMRRAGIVNVDRVVVVNLRGRASALALGSEAGRERLSAFLRAHEAEVVILDPLAPVLASLGLDENGNAEVSTFYSWWSETLAAAGVLDDLVVHHTGHAGERSRGASRLLDEPDAIWTLTRAAEDEEDGFTSLTPTRYLAAYGRDVEMPNEALEYDPDTHRLHLTGESKVAAKGSKIERRILATMADGKLRTRNGICTELGGNRNGVWDAVGRLIEAGSLINTGQKTRQGHDLLGYEAP